MHGVGFGSVPGLILGTPRLTLTKLLVYFVRDETKEPRHQENAPASRGDNPPRPPCCIWRGRVHDIAAEAVPLQREGNAFATGRQHQESRNNASAAETSRTWNAMNIPVEPLSRASAAQKHTAATTVCIHVDPGQHVKNIF